MNLDTSFNSDAGDDNDIENRNPAGKSDVEIVGVDETEQEEPEDIDIEDSDSEEITELEWETDETLPKGWKINLFELTYGEMRGVTLKRYRSPCDNFFGNLPDVLKF